MARILVVDDDSDLRRLLCNLLGEEGHAVQAAGDGQRAVEMVLNSPPELVVLDVMMPRMDGFQVLDSLRAARVPGVKVLVLTARSSESDWAEGYRRGADHYLSKPFDPDEFCEAVDDILAMSKEQLKVKRLRELEKAQLLSQLESIFD
jgi:DNA-binding response OmpR family regulator